MRQTLLNEGASVVLVDRAGDKLNSSAPSWGRMRMPWSSIS
jgi:hypothetical protein